MSESQSQYQMLKFQKGQCQMSLFQKSNIKSEDLVTEAPTIGSLPSTSGHIVHTYTSRKKALLNL